MIRGARFKGFQGHEDLIIEFSPHITTITGATDIGKSAIVRGLYWAVMNKPGGTGFINYHHKLASVAIKLEDSRISRVKGRTKKNAYIVTIDGQRQVFEAFKNEIPKDVTKILNMNELNFQLQHDAPFWFSNSAGEVSRQLNRIVDLEIIDKSLARLAGNVRTAKAKIEVCKDRLKKAKEKYLSLKIIKQAMEDFREILKWRKKRRAAIETMGQLEEALFTIHEEKKILEDMGTKLQEGKRIIQLGKKVEIAKNMVSGLSLQIDNIEEQKRIAEQDIPNIDALSKLAQRIKRIGERAAELKSAMKEVQERKKELCEKEKSHSIAVEDFQNEIGEICPLCGNATP